MDGVLCDDEGEVLEDGVAPSAFEVDDHVRQLGEVEFYAVEDVPPPSVLFVPFEIK